uniref:Uncharacterized protein n=1 Tax=Myoviridae sp. ctLjW1 TaxID=2825084 RepID=A0A8S5PNM2_9CAUD|nr:MAG TPA: hypothetical protein [Myoviridae sp. ctLjW1]
MDCHNGCISLIKKGTDVNSKTHVILRDTVR